MLKFNLERHFAFIYDKFFDHSSKLSYKVNKSYMEVAHYLRDKELFIYDLFCHFLLKYHLIYSVCLSFLFSEIFRFLIRIIRDTNKGSAILLKFHKEFLFYELSDLKQAKYIFFFKDQR